LPGTELHFLTKGGNKTILYANPYIDRFHFLQPSLYDTVRQLSNQKYDLIIDLHNNIRSSIICLFCGAKTIRFNKANIAKWLKVNFKMDILPKKHIVDRYFEALHPLNIENDHKGLDFFIEPDNQFKHPFLTKKKISRHFVLLGDKNDVISANIIAKLFPSKVLNLCGKINLQQSASIIKNANAVITGDTALMHIAAAFNKIIFSIWGNTIPQLGMYPYLFKYGKNLSIKDLHIYENNNLNCRPCSKIGYNKCPKQHFGCMLQIDYHKLIDDISIKTY